MTRRSLLVVGAGGHARELLDVIDGINDHRPTYEVVGLVDDDQRFHGRIVNDVPVIGSVADGLAAHRGIDVAIGIGNSAARARVAASLRTAGTRVPVLVHPGASVTRRVALAAGAVVAARAVLTTGVTVGSHTHINIAATVSHDCILGDFVTLGPGSHLAGAVRVGDGCDLGVGVCVIPGVHLGSWSIVGAGAVITRNTEPDVTVVGTPARVVKRRTAGWHEGAR